jgi:2-polyprenyl-6-hydroxyphenyl methylase/3-demethylubiquinone-9 3-methyltransferase
MLEVENLKGKTFLDIGSGSGIFSMCAMRLGAERVHSFDYDPGSVACTKELKRRYFPDDARWAIEEGSVLDKEYLSNMMNEEIAEYFGMDKVYCSKPGSIEAKEGDKGKPKAKKDCAENRGVIK